MLHRLRSTREQSLAELFGELADEFEQWVAAELAVIKAQLESNTRKLLTSLILLLVAAVIALAGVVVLAHTLIVLLAPYLGPGLAGLLISLVLLILAVACVVYARSKMSMFSLVPDRLRKSFISEKVRS